jgi:hypothetical protein
MKTRNGFVSNSSSSSFVLIGVALPRKGNSMEELVEKLMTKEELDELVGGDWDTADEDEKHDAMYNILPIDILDDDEGGAPRGKTLVGKCIRISDEDPVEDSFALADIIKDLENRGLDTNNIRLYVGTMCT